MKPIPPTVLSVLCLIAVIGLLQPFRAKLSAQAAPAGDDVGAALRLVPLGPLLGKQVLVIPTGHEAKEGKLEAFDASWVRIRVQEGDVRCYAAANVVMIAGPVEAPKP